MGCPQFAEIGQKARGKRAEKGMLASTALGLDPAADEIARARAQTKREMRNGKLINLMRARRFRCFASERCPRAANSLRSGDFARTFSLAAARARRPNSSQRTGHSAIVIISFRNVFSFSISRNQCIYRCAQLLLSPTQFFYAGPSAPPTRTSNYSCSIYRYC